MIGRTISHYQVLEKLGEGGMGVVYKARDLKLDRFTALKFLPSNLGTDEEQKRRFIQEAKAASSIDHPNIGAIYEIDETADGLFFIAMAYYEGETLKHKIEQGPLPLASVLDYSKQIAGGLATAHRHGIIHRDLKPGNVLVTTEGTVKIIDFGLAKLARGVEITRTGTSVGTVAYMSPEQARGEEVDANTDVWALGVVMYEMLTGRRPFQGEFETAVMYSILNESYEPVHNSRTDVPLDMERIVDRALQKDQHRRYPNAQELLDDLTSLQNDLQYGLASARSTSRIGARIAAIPDRRIITAAATVVFLVAALIAWILFHPLAPSHPPADTQRLIAVLPFVNLGGAEDDYYVDGLTQESIAGLSGLPNIVVIAQKSSFFYRGSKLSDSSIAAELGVRYLLKGQLRPTVARLNFSARLYDAEHGTEIWNERYDIARWDVLGLKEKMLQEIAARLGVDENRSTPSSPATTSDVYEAYLHGLFYRERVTKDDNLLAMTFLSEAIRKDPSFVPALLALANAQVEQYKQGWDQSPRLLGDAHKHCEQVLQIDSTNSAALAILGMLADIGGQPTEGLSLFQRALEKDGNNAIALTSIAQMSLFEVNEPAKGVMYLKRLQEIEPLDWLTWSDLGVGYAQIKNYTEAIKSFQTALKFNPQHDWPSVALAYTYERLGQLDSASVHYADALRKNPTNPKTYESLLSILLINKRFAQAESVMNSATRYLPTNYQVLYGLGVAYLLDGNSARAKQVWRQGSALVEDKLREHPEVGDIQAFAGLFQARLGNAPSAMSHALQAVRLDSTNEEIMAKLARISSIIGRKQQMLEYFRKAKRMNPEYDAAYLATALDFERYRDDPDLLLLSKQE